MHNEIMKEEFLELFNKWHSSYMFSARGSADPRAKEHYEKLKKWCENHYDEALEYIKELLLEEPCDIVRILDDVYQKEYGYFIKGFCPLDVYCNWWLNIIMGTHNNGHSNINYYKDYNAWSNYLKYNYIPWDPRIEADPNVTLEEFKLGKRNDKNLLKERKYGSTNQKTMD